ncbi:hypothetical protein LCGC14_1369310 [marine sediment metagenome]
MALLVLFSTFSFTVAQHYCDDVLVNYSFSGHAESCGMEVQETADLPECNLVQDNCCSDEVLTVDGQNDLKVSFDKLSFEQQQFVAMFIYTYLNLYEGLSENIVPFSNYPPPLLVKDIQILDQIFLI